MAGILVHVLGSAALGSVEQVRVSIKLMDAEIAQGPAIIVLSGFFGSARPLARAARAALDGGQPFEPILRDLEERFFSVIRDAVDVRRQSGVIAGVRQQMNQIEEILGGVAMLREFSPRTDDMVAAQGRWLSAYVFAECLKERRADARLLDPRGVIVTDNRHGRARILHDPSADRIRRDLGGAAHPVVIPGSVGATIAGEPTTLGRSGSTLAASVIAAALDAEELVVWTGSDGILTADPVRVSTARPVACMSYVEATEMMHFGGDFLYPPSLIPAIRHGVPIRVRNARNRRAPGTLLTATCSTDRRFAGISSMDEIALLQIQGNGMVGVTGTAHRLFGALAAAKANVVLISQASSEHSICVGVSSADAPRAKEAVEEAFRGELTEGLIDDVSVEEGLSIIAVVGERMKRTMGLAAIIFGTLSGAQVNVKAIAQGSSEQNVSIVVDAADQNRALNALHKALIEDGVAS